MDHNKRKQYLEEIEKQECDNIVASTSKQGKLIQRRNWSVEEKTILLEALKKHGSQNITAISRMLSNISPKDIKSKISEYSKIAKELYESELLDRWLECGLYEHEDSLIPAALLFIKLFEDHPPPSEIEGYNLRAIYDFLYRSCSEQVSYYDLSPKDRTLLCCLMSKVESKVWPKYKTEILEYVGTHHKRRNIKKVYPGKSGHSP